jgi:hypothetical protein
MRRRDQWVRMIDQGRLRRQTCIKNPRGVINLHIEVSSLQDQQELLNTGKSLATVLVHSRPDPFRQPVMPDPQATVDRPWIQRFAVIANNLSGATIISVRSAIED